ncbi:MAG TPA: rhamnulokinase, partial [Firmicutes bacterium]|nr:rhamnulokinase [Bacillota bacterium]
MDSVHLALDFGSASGRLVAGKFNGERLKLQEIHRFPNQPVRFNGRLYWDFLRLFHEMMTGLKKASRLGLKVESIGTDTWGVDYAFLDKQGFLLGDLIHYRDDRGNGMLEEIKKDTSVSLADIYEVTGIHYMTLNSLFQLYYDVKYRPHIVEKADALLFLPDLFTYGLTGEKYNEYTIASTSQMLDARKKIWAAGLLEKLGLPVHLLQKLIEPGTICGMLAKPIQAEVGLPAIPVIAVGSHDTASAVAATPLQSKNSAYLSSGSWSLFGVELTEPLINQKSSKHNFTNEGGVEGTIRYLKNITGLWIIQQLKKKWSAADPTIDYSWISREAQKAQTECAIAPDHEDFLAPYDMEKAILDYCRDEFGQNLRGRAEIARSVYNGIAT